MHVDRPIRRQKPISLTPLVDVIFLLLLFFMLSSTFTNFGQVEIGAPAGGGGSGTVPKAILVLDGERLRLNGRDIADEALLQSAQDLIDRDIDSLLVQVRENTTTQNLVSVMTRLRSLPGLKVTVTGSG
ncbi:biopolymer transporter ExbD [Roseibium aggregatum]|uniref:Biopolymer transporter ExbD n=1 Tax=Roseibium aggregatum TaxID=187304 RepID=A0A939EEZ6_9HYPH|nr:biopolymer transporter ExbD [Roseibium aggregatum]MBN9671930.1 biopolymer transporter ExbD [Roseibium aggregatum]